MPSIAKRIDGRWRARYRDSSGREHSKHFSRRVDAQRWLDEVTASVVTGSYVGPRSARITIGDYSERWRSSQVHRPTTAAQVETNLRRHVRPFFCERPLGSVRRSEVQAWVKGRSEVLAPATVELVYRYLSAVFRAAVEDRLIPSSPCSRIALPRREQRRVEPLGTDAVLALIEAVPARYAALVVLAAGTGLRQGECFGLTVEHLDMLRRMVHVEQQLVLMPGAAPYLAAPKTDASRRTVPLPAVVVDALARHLATYPVGPHGLIFTTEHAEPIRRTSFSTIWRPAVKVAELPDRSGFHSLRHYYASLLIRHGESVKVLQARLGHASASETLDTYSHLWPDSEDRTRQAVDEVLGSAPADSLRTGSAY